MHTNLIHFVCLDGKKYKFLLLYKSKMLLLVHKEMHTSLLYFVYIYIYIWKKHKVLLSYKNIISLSTHNEMFCMFAIYNLNDIISLIKFYVLF
jgi:hypothetical protein